MNLRKNLGRVASTIVATALLASVATVPAFAAGAPLTGNADPTTGDYTATMTKNLTMAQDVFQPTETFEFTITPFEHAEGVTHEVIQGIPVSDGVENGVTVGTAAFTSSETRTETASITIKVDKSVFDDANAGAGIYKYTLSENTGDNAYVDYDEAVKYLYVYIKNDGEDIAISGVEVRDKNGETTNGKTDKTDSFNNAYGTVDGDEKLHNLTLKKTMSGDAANYNEKFEFTVNIATNDNTNQVYTVKQGTTTTTITAGTSETYTLGKDDTVQIIGLREGDTYTITESDVTNGKTGSGYTVSVTEGADQDGVANGETEGAITTDSADEVKVTYNNARENVTPTGIVMNIAPYALLVVVAVAGCFVFLRKRNED